jgi:hypoxanthine phosphoribosyltransferase
MNERTFSSKVQIHLTWEEYIGMILNLIDLIKKSGKKIDYVYGVPRGGLIPAVIISHALEIPILSNFMDGKDGTVLIVDDLVDTGKTIIDLIAIRKNMNIVVVTLFKHKECRVFPDIYVQENVGWIYFPYEKEEV